MIVVDQTVPTRASWCLWMIRLRSTWKWKRRRRPYRSPASLLLFATGLALIVIVMVRRRAG